MADVLGLTHSNTIRATLGVDDHDLPDQSVTDFDVASNLRIDLRTWFPQWSALVADVSGDAVIADQLAALKIYAKYFCAYEILISGQMKFLQRRADGDNQSHRYKEDKLEELRLAYKSRMEQAQAQVLDITTSFSPTGSGDRTYSQFGISKPTTDVVTG